MKIHVNGEHREVTAESDTPLLWVLRDELDLKGTKFGCGAALCGACTVLVDGEAIRSCSLPLLAVGDRKVETIEAMATDGELHPVQQAWMQVGVPQCGYCQSGVIMATIRLLRATPEPTDQDIDRSLTNLCRCGTYERMRAAVHLAAAKMKTQ